MKCIAKFTIQWKTTGARSPISPAGPCLIICALLRITRFAPVIWQLYIIKNNDKTDRPAQTKHGATVISLQRNLSCPNVRITMNWNVMSFIRPRNWIIRCIPVMQTAFIANALCQITTTADALSPHRNTIWYVHMIRKLSAVHTIFLMKPIVKYRPHMIQGAIYLLHRTVNARFMQINARAIWTHTKQDNTWVTHEASWSEKLSRPREYGARCVFKHIPHRPTTFKNWKCEVQNSKNLSFILCDG